MAEKPDRMHTDYIYRRDCFAFNVRMNGKPSCHALTKMDCMTCNFYKTRARVAEENRITHERLTKLGLKDLIR